MEPFDPSVVRSAPDSEKLTWKDVLRDPRSDALRAHLELTRYLDQVIPNQIWNDALFLRVCEEWSYCDIADILARGEPCPVASVYGFVLSAKAAIQRHENRASKWPDKDVFLDWLRNSARAVTATAPEPAAIGRLDAIFRSRATEVDRQLLIYEHFKNEMQNEAWREAFYLRYLDEAKFVNIHRRLGCSLAWAHDNVSSAKRAVEVAEGHSIAWPHIKGDHQNGNE
jgi:hypothetical protein